jgi:hypothetical protein
MTKLPESVTHWKYHDVCGDKDGPSEPLFSEAQLLQFRRDALEEAAMWLNSYDGDTNSRREEAIRKLKDET